MAMSDGQGWLEPRMMIQAETEAGASARGTERLPVIYRHMFPVP